VRTYLAVVDESPEARIALRFAARRAARTGGGVTILALAEVPEFSAWGGVQAAMEEEALLRVEALVAAVAGEVIDEAGLHPKIVVRAGDPVKAVSTVLEEENEVAALVLGAAASGSDPGPLVDHFAAAAGTLPCPLMIIPGSLDEAALDLLS
jgi:nucleotide-binding universal stress UspA family protein